MAGMLPGVEAARRRRFHQTNLTSGGGGGSTRLSFSLHATNYYSSPSMERNPLREVESCNDEELEAVAREAKKRLDHRFSRPIRNIKSRGEKIYIFKDFFCSFGNSDNN